MNGLTGLAVMRIGRGEGPAATSGNNAPVTRSAMLLAKPASEGMIGPTESCAGT
jgi:hypothetical protein